MVATVLAVDLGKTRCRLVLHPTDEQITVDGDLGIAAPGGPARIAERICAAADDLGSAGSAGGLIEYVSVGAAGVLSAPEAGAEFAGELARVFRRPVAVASDAITAHIGAFAGEPGIVLIAGTGATAIGIGIDGEFRAIDGAGPEIGDLGSGAWLGRQGAIAAVRGQQGSGPATNITAALDRHIPAGIPAAAQWSLGSVDDSPARRLAALAPIVLSSAREQDPVAGGIVDAAITHLVNSARAAGSEHSNNIVTVGGLTQDGWFTDMLHDRLRAAGLRPRAAAGSALDGAIRAATHTTLVHERQILRAP